MPATEVAGGAGCFLFVLIWGWGGVYKKSSVWKVCVRIQDPGSGAEVCSLL